MPYKNPADAKARHRRYYLLHRAEHLVRAKAWNKAHPEQRKRHLPRTAHDKAKEKALRQTVKTVINWLKETTPCADCRLYWPAPVMDFDHVRGVKRFDLSRCAGFSPRSIALEIAKCDLVCANCHRIRTAKRRTS